MSENRALCSHLIDFNTIEGSLSNKKAVLRDENAGHQPGDGDPIKDLFFRGQQSRTPSAPVLDEHDDLDQSQGSCGSRNA